MLWILERVQQRDEPGRLGCRQDISLDENVLDLAEETKNEQRAETLSVDVLKSRVGQV